MLWPLPSLGPARLVPLYRSSFKQYQRDLVPAAGWPFRAHQERRVAFWPFPQKLVNVARLPLLLWGDWGFFKIPQCSSSSLKEGCRGNSLLFCYFTPCSADVWFRINPRGKQAFLVLHKQLKGYIIKKHLQYRKGKREVLLVGRRPTSAIVLLYRYGVGLLSHSCPPVPFRGETRSHKRFLKDKDLIWDSQDRPGVTGLSMFPTGEHFTVCKGVIQIQASCPKFFKKLNALSVLCSKCSFGPGELMRTSRINAPQLG